MIERSEAIVACRGFAADTSDPSATVLCWGTVARAHHGPALGRMLLVERLKRPTGHVVRLNTSPRTRAFCERFGFRTLKIVSSGHGPGRGRHEMWMP